jgi:hypothetical protein
VTRRAAALADDGEPCRKCSKRAVYCYEERELADMPAVNAAHAYVAQPWVTWWECARCGTMAAPPRRRG